MFILLIDVDDDTRSVVFNDLSLHDKYDIYIYTQNYMVLSTYELVDVVLGLNYAQGFDLSVDLHLVDVDDVVPPTVKLGDDKRHAPLLFNFLLHNSLHFDVNEMISFQKLVGNLDKITVANSIRQHQRSLNSNFNNSLEYLYLFEVISEIVYTIYIPSPCCICI
jgi:hypothetical protein